METNELTPSVPQEQFDIEPDVKTIEADLEETSAPPRQEETPQAEPSPIVDSAPEETAETLQPDETVIDFPEEEAKIHSEAPELEISENEVDEQHAPEDHSADFSNKTKKEIIDLFENILKTKPVQAVRRDAEAVKIAFYKIYRAEIEQLRRDFIAEGNPAENFVVASDEQEERLKALFAEYRKQRNSYIANSEEQKEASYKIKLKIIEQLKELVNSKETMNQTFAAFRELQNAWKEAGSVPQAYVKDLWETYHLHVENFYNFIKINNELRDLDIKKNTEAKMKLCEEAEELLLENSAVSAFHKLQKLHEQWREVGPVSTEYKEQLWERFKDVSSKINKRHQDHFEEIKEEQKRNLDLKNELCVKTEELAAKEFTTKNEWEKASQELIDIQKVWKTIGFAPKKENTEVYERFRAACDSFFERKREFYSRAKVEMDEHYQAKIELCIAAEAIQDSTDWKKTSDEFIALQKRWKDTGSVSRKHSDAVWKRFRKACDAFFLRKAEHFSQTDSKYAENLGLKKALLEEIKAYEITDREAGFEALKDFQRRWAEIGFVPIKEKDKLQAAYRTAIDEHFANLRSGDKERKIDRFREKLSTFKGKGSVRSERERLLAKVRQAEADIALLENNIGFFSKSKNAEAMIRDVRNKIEKAREDLAVALEKIAMIDREE